MLQIRAFPILNCKLQTDVFDVVYADVLYAVDSRVFTKQWLEYKCPTVTHANKKLIPVWQPFAFG